MLSSRKTAPCQRRGATAVGSKKRQRSGADAPSDLAVDLTAAVEFIGKLKVRFGDSSPELATFLQVLVEYRAGRLSTAQVVETVAVVLRDHPDLLESFTYFAPKYQTHTRCAAARARFEGIYPPNVVMAGRADAGAAAGQAQA